jgi:Bacteriophage Lambda NinG protein
MRYRGIKGRFWKVFSDFIRLRDYKKYGTCITCGKRKTYAELQAGHYLAAGNCGFGLLFDEENVNGECAGDNAFNSNHQIDYRKNLIERIKEHRVVALEKRFRDSHYGGKSTKEWTKKEYEAKIKEYKEKIKLL